jgi:hypothetical protein
LSDHDEDLEAVIDEDMAVREDTIEVNGRKTHSWEMNVNASPAAIGEKVLMLTLTNPQQVFRMFRADDVLFITAVEGEEWERVPIDPQD